MSIPPEILQRLRLERGESIRHFGLTLKRVIEPSATRGFSHPYILALEQGKRPLTDELERAYSALMAMEDEGDPVLAQARPTTVLATHDVTNALITFPAKQCERPGCRFRFLPRVSNQRYHSKWCRKQAYKAAAAQQKLEKAKEIK